ncbi:hypothetical protein BDZ97DRAFT_1775912 [Flammula alnicola]|nr:hypothetical protein BDZ97DRAFT_1775912 [Flammula alnicola]
MDLRQVAFHDHPSVFFTALSAVTATIALRPDSTILPMIGALSVLLVYSPILFRPSEHRWVNVFLIGVALSVASSVLRLQASLEALSTPGGSLVALFTFSALLSSLSLTALYVSTKFYTRLGSSWSQVTLFPAIWATLWCTVSYISPVGHLSTWSVANNMDAYNWVTPFLGPVSKDWIVGAWAVVISETVGYWHTGFSEDTVDLLNFPQDQHRRFNNKKATKILTLLLTFLTIPSFIFSNSPLPVSPIDAVTPLSVACALPPYQHYKRHVLTLEDYIRETDTLRSMAKIILWPEGAVTFHSVEERENAFNEVRKRIPGVYVGVSFEETISDPNDSTGRKPITRTGLAVVSQKSNDTYHTYYKRHLVPVAESYRLTHSTAPPTLFEAQLPKPHKYIPSKQWGHGPDYTRPLPLTSSICLDFAAPFPFAALESRPALILAPARTWDRTVGNAMWLQAKQRAEELDSMILWCDGGEGGVSGVAGGGFNDVTQVGSGSFIRTIGIQYPFDSQRTPYARFGDFTLILFWIFALGPGFIPRVPFGNLQFKFARRGIYSGIQTFRGWIGHGQTERAPEQDLLG